MVNMVLHFRHAKIIIVALYVTIEHHNFHLLSHFGNPRNLSAILQILPCRPLFGLCFSNIHLFGSAKKIVERQTA